MLDVDKGQPVRVIPVHESLFITTMTWGRLAALVPDPRRAEDPKALKYASPEEREQAALRNEIQRMIVGSKKENAVKYARYIANGLRGSLEKGWATPPFALWIPEKLEHITAAGPYGEDHLAYLPYGVNGVLIDSETQHVAHLILQEQLGDHGLTKKQLTDRLVPVEIYHNMSLTEARQIFHDRNLLGVIPNKTVGLNSDSNDVATGIAFTMMDKILVPHPISKVDVPLRSLVSANKRQLGAKDIEWMTLSTLRSFAVTALFGRAGFERTSGAVTSDDLPSGVTEQEVRESVTRVATALFRAFATSFSRRVETVIGSPAVLAAIGAVAHRSMPWGAEPRRTTDQLVAMLSAVRWERYPEVWDGIAGKSTPGKATLSNPNPPMQLSLAGGIKDNSSKVTTALEDATADTYRRVRAQLP
ncbi:hypothetical protein IU433_17580 [Nocardia puris]|nr:DNA sulfur modification protein DndB [Nocardia puris]MBF6212256.1 hypothetical protein [Nocardia puris]MBF6366503.1 hypothetical protein [Nocardia puris]MBF6460845.1 hypothetical protein [Nocardia puris]